MELPVKLHNSPLIDCIIEIRFVPAMRISSAVFGVIYNQVKNLYKGNVIPLPLVNLPENIRETNPNLKYKPLYFIEGKKTNIQIGTDVINVISKMPYIGWSEFSKSVEDVFQKVFECDVVGNVIRLGHRYVNFVKGDISSELNIILNGKDVASQISNINYRIDIPNGDFNNCLMFTNTGRYNDISGSLIDIDTSRIYTDEYFKNNITQEIENAHKSEKQLFFKLLSDKLLQSFNPEYSNE